MQLELPGILRAPGWDEAHFVRLAPGGKRPSGPWRTVFPSYSEVRAHAEAGGGAGVVPHTVRIEDEGLTVLDCDGGDVLALCEAYPPIMVSESSPGHHHCWYADPSPGRRNGTWRGPGGCHGDVRSASGYVRFVSDGAARLDSALLHVSVDDAPFPAHLIVKGGTVTGEGALLAARAARSEYARAEKLFEAALVEATPVLSRDVRIGNRHVMMVKRLARWGGRRTWNGETVDDWFIARRAAACFLALPGRTLPGDDGFREPEMVAILDWTLRMRPAWARAEHTPEFRAEQARRGRKGGLAGYGSTVDGEQRQSLLPGFATNEVLRPWEQEGISRAWWYRKRQRSRE